MAKRRIPARADVRGSRVQIEVQRRRLFKIAGVIAVSRAALATKLEIDEQSVIDALQAAGDMVEDLADAVTKS